MTCEHNFLGESTCEHCGASESAILLARAQRAEAHVATLRAAVLFALDRYALDTCDIPNGGTVADPEWVSTLSEALRTTSVPPEGDKGR